MPIVAGMSEDRATATATATATDPAGLRQVRAQHQMVQRWLRGLGPIVTLVIVVAAVRDHPGPGIEGRGLVVSIAIAGVAASFIGGAWGAVRSSDRPSVIFGATLLASSVALMWAQPTGPGAASALVGVLFVVRQLPVRAAVAISVAAVAILAASSQVIGHGHGPGAAMLAALAGFAGMTFLAGQLGRANDQAARLLAELEASRAAEARTAGLAERQRLAREMHDVLAHSLSGLLLKLEGARMLAARNPADLRLPEMIDAARRLGMSGLDEARRAIGALRGDEMPGPDQLPELAAWFGQDRGIPCRLTVTGTERQLGVDLRLAVYRVAQEALTNIAKHAHPDCVEVRLAYLPDATRLAIEDFAAADAPGSAARPGPADGGGYGLTGMRERLELAGGRLVAGPSQDGWTVTAEIPA
jgi:signal transduction histidine kinase